MFKTRTINSQKISPMILPQTGQGAFRGSDLFSEPYCNVFLCARKKSGKTNVIMKILKECVTPKTTVIAFCSTLQRDTAWMQIQDYLKGKKVEFIGHTSIKDDEGNNQLAELLTNLKNATKMKHEYIFVFDDLGEEIRDKSVNQLLKTNRHFHAKVLISSQYVKDVSPQAMRQIDYFILFGRLSDENLETIHKNADLPISLDKFLKAYEQATTAPYDFLYIDTRDDDYRINFSKRIIV